MHAACLALLAPELPSSVRLSSKAMPAAAAADDDGGDDDNNVDPTTPLPPPPDAGHARAEIIVGQGILFK